MEDGYLEIIMQICSLLMCVNIALAVWVHWIYGLLAVVFRFLYDPQPYTQETIGYSKWIDRSFSVLLQTRNCPHCGTKKVCRHASYLPLQVHVLPSPQLWHSVWEAETLLKGLCSSEVAPQDLRVAHVPNRLQQGLGGRHQVGRVSIHGVAQR